MFNIWDEIVKAIFLIVVSTAASLLPPGTGPEAINTQVNFFQTMFSTVALVIELCGASLNMFNLKLIVVAMLWNGALLVVQLIVSIYTFIKDLIPFA